MDLLAMNLNEMQDWLQWGGYLILFIVLFSCGLGVPIPEDIPLLLAGFFVAQGKMNLGLAAVIAWCGIIGGDMVLYHLGRRFGPSISRIPLIGHHFTPQRLEWVERLFERWGTWVVAVLRMFPGVRGVMVLAAGTIRFNLLKFVMTDGIAAIVSGGLFVFLGWLAGRYVGDRDLDTFYKQEIHPYKTWFGLGALVLLVLFITYLWWRHRRHKSLSEAVVEKAAEIFPPHKHNPPAK